MRKLLFTFTLMCISIFMFAQVTTSSIVGKITSTEGEELIGANITAVHMPSGSQYGTASLDGSFRIPNMRVGGPYTVQVSYIGYESQKIEDVFLSLGEKMRLDFQLTSEGISMDEIVVTARSSSVLNGERTGASSTITQEQLSQLPTISRAVSDYTRLNPMAAEGGSFGGRNDQYNNYSVDGSIFNNPFGLDGSTPGSQTSAQPIPLDAIDQIQVSISPYDVSLSGFTGASVNAVTKSGTNDFNGSVYGFFRNQNMTGSKVNGNDAVAGDLSHGQYGVSFSGPIVKNKVFFFANVETERRSDLGSYYVPRENASQAIGGKYSRVLEEDMQKVADLLKAKGWDSGDFSGFNHRADNTKAIFKLDFNLHKNHKLTATYNFLSAYKDKPAHPSAIGRRGPDETTLQFENSGYRINNKIQSGIIELNSMFGTTVSNKIQVGYTKFDDFREPKSTPFPVLNILKDGQRYIIAGHEPFSIHNVLDQSVFQINDQLNYYLGDHTITLGGSFEKFQFDNSFNLTSYGFSIFGGTDINDFEDYVNGTGAFTEYNLDGDIAAAKAADEAQTWALAETNVGQLGLYLQDEWSVNDQFTLTYGLRIDKPLFFDTEEKMKESISRSYGYNPELKFEAEDGTMYDFTHYGSDGNPIQLNSEVFPTAKVQFNPRIGFNYAIKADRSQQLRGETGLFSGRFPFVWIGNQVANPNADFYCITDPDFEFPQVWRTNIGYDHKFGAGWVASFDAIYTKDRKAAMVKNYGLANHQVN